MAEPKWMIQGGQPTRKFRYSMTTGALTALLGGPALGKIMDYYLGRIDPLMPSDIRATIAGFLAALVTIAVTAAVAWATRPDPDDRPVIDPTTDGSRIEPLPDDRPGIPPAD